MKKAFDESLKYTFEHCCKEYEPDIEVGICSDCGEECAVVKDDLRVEPEGHRGKGVSVHTLTGRGDPVSDCCSAEVD